MSGIIGYCVLNKKSSQKNDFDKMVNSIAHRGLDGISKYKENDNKFAFLLTKNTPESFLEQNQLKLQDDVLLIADCRIDNTIELKRQLKIDTNKTISDSELLIKCYSKWGIKMTENLIGDFAISIYDKKQKKVYLIRDHSGVRPLYFTLIDNEIFSFASEINVLLKIPNIKKEINYPKIGTYLTRKTDFRGYNQETYYKNIYSVHPNTYLEFDLKTKNYKEHNYWKIDLNRFKHLKTNKDFSDAFKETFNIAIKRRIKSNYNIASHLSGGLDSTYISTVARDLLLGTPLYTLHNLPESPLTDETEYAKKVIETGGMQHKWIKPNKNYKSSFKELNIIQDQPDPNTVPSNLYEINSYLKKHNIRTLLTGCEGDITVDSGKDIYKLYFEQKNFDELKNLNSFESDKNTIIKNIIKNQLLLLLKTFKIRDFYCLITELRKHDITNTSTLTLGFISYFKNIFTRKNTIINKSFIKKYKLKQYYKKSTKYKFIPHGLNKFQLLHFKRINCGAITIVNEYYNQHASKYQIDVSHPFQDKDLIELCLATPLNLKYYNGIGRGQMRLAMEGIVIKDIINRKTKIDFSPVLKSISLEIENDYFHHNKINNEIIDIKKLKKEINLIKKNNDNYYSNVYHYLSAIKLTEWLNQKL